MAGRVLRWASALGVAALWWWAVLRLAAAPDAGALEGTIAAGGWGLSLLPVHCVPKERALGVAGARRRLSGARGRPRRVRRGAVTKASPRRRWGGGSGRS
ncbi:hypothetical protein CP982_30475 [Streptomyces spectabilis]|uniref:Uncharacterized protein n=1 Tax=Streptomyces spectabilis TaxID=68270 RepID=A0A5P2XP65_STRST|nr:hypothetical protein [Streptomyces spectabilis]MCI3905538.1 hypothetical protein [Streptomyces spectabilis]QEV64985.1 hypothetical protein CP982_30475 [Streptomyces spectabilis]